MTLTLPVGNLALSVELKVRRNRRRMARSGIEWDGGGSEQTHPRARTGDGRFDPVVEKMRAEAFVQLVNRRLA